MKLSVFVLIAILSIANISVLTAEENISRKFMPLDVFDLEYASDPQPSPNGKEIIYVRRSNDIMTDRTRSNIWTIKPDGSNHRPLLSGRDNYTSARWSPDGSKIAYISSSEGNNQIYIRWNDTAQTALLSNLTASPSSLTWSPDGQWLAFTMSVDGKKPVLAKSPPKPEGAKWADPVHVIDAVRYQSDGQGILSPGHTHIFIIPSEGVHRVNSRWVISTTAGLYHGRRTAQKYYFPPTAMKSGNWKRLKAMFFLFLFLMERLHKLPICPDRKEILYFHLTEN
jgi:dipeptidyl aminopeptidase/acylaminoacyl peptidase